MLSSTMLCSKLFGAGTRSIGPLVSAMLAWPVMGKFRKPVPS
jgi:hypothetical protein